ncbi:MAG: PAS domain S-box protein [Deltaproteobacteria bacterium]|nr:PAS domain S-box protein [Deltaproteobacteria bacterium]
MLTLPRREETAPAGAEITLPRGSPLYAEFLAWLDYHAADLVDEWVTRLAGLSPNYKRRPTPELFGTVNEAFRANQEMLTTGSLERISGFIRYITEMRLHAGFPLSDVQRAFELFRIIVCERLGAPALAHLLPVCLTPLNLGLAFTIHRFSDLFQQMAERAIRSHAQGLERTVRIRTAELAESEERYRTLVNEIDDGYFIVQGDRVAFANLAFCRLHGADPATISGRTFGDFVTPECRPRVLDALRLAQVGRSPGGQMEYHRAGCPPTEAPTDMKYKSVELGRAPVTIGICRDISGRVAMENRLRENERMAYVGQIAASLSHEIRNPLSTCTLNMMILQDKLRLEGFDRRRLEMTVHELTRLDSILHQLLDMARPMNIVPAPLNLTSAAHDCVELLTDRVKAAGVAVRQVHAPDLPRVLADVGKLEQAILNLMLNALESLERGGRIIVWTRLAETEAGRWVELGVHDNGPGLDAEMEAHLFQPFYTKKTRGTGLGLSIVRRIMEAHGGTVAARGRQGIGVAFILRLPCRS